MIRIFTYSFWLILIFLYYLIYSYRNSKNKHLFFKTGIYRPLLSVLLILLMAPLIVNLLLPDVGLKLDTLHIIHTDEAGQKSLLIQGNLISYCFNIVSVIGHNMNLVGFVSALLILFTWFTYVQRIDLFHKEDFKYPLVTLFLGMGFSLLTFLLSDIAHLFYPTGYSGNFFNDLFIYCFLRIGVIEELVKLLPFLIMLKFTNQINEPYDYILYACLSALGFAFIENLIYFRELDGVIIQGRALLSVVGHMLFSSFAVYGLVLAKYRHRQSALGYFIISFLVGAFLHGLYDYLLFKSLIFLVIPLFIFSVQTWTVIVNNAINNSKFFDFSISFQAERLRFLLAIMLSGILVLNYFTNALQFGKQIANQNYISSCVYGGLLIVFYVTSLSNYDLINGYWRPIELRISPPSNNYLTGKKGTGSLLSIFKYNFIIPVNIVNYRISLHTPHYNKVLYGLMAHATGKIIDRVCLYSKKENDEKEYIDTEWFLVELENPLSIQQDIEYAHINSHVLIKLESNNDSLIHDEDIRGFLRLIPDMSLVNGEKPVYDDFASAGYILINSIEIPEYSKNG